MCTVVWGAIGMPAIRWPEGQAAIQSAWLEYYQAMEGLSASLLRLFALALRLPENWFDDKITAHRSAFRMLNYPPQATPPLPGQIRAGEHTDYGTLTILKSDEKVAGLQVLARDGLCAALCSAVLCCAVLCCAVLCCAVLCCAVLCCAVLCLAPSLCVTRKQTG
jgi:isopenicillin N synthase-like dioxygenase